jgi:hypothetical protein
MAAIANEPAPKAPRVPSWRPIGALAAMVAAAIAVYALPGGWLPRWPGLTDVTQTALPLDALRPSALEPLIRSFDALLAPALPWAGIVIAIAAAANVALFVATGRDRRTPA